MLKEKLSEALKNDWANLSAEAKATIKEFAKDLDKAEADLSEFAEEVSWGPLPEAPYSTNFTMVDPVTDNWNQFTIRAHTHDALMSQMVALRDKLASSGWLSRHSWEKQSFSNEPAFPTQQQTQAPQQDSGEYGEAILKEMKASLYNDNWSWKIETNKSKYPVSVYEAINELGLSVDRNGQQVRIGHEGPFVDEQGRPYSFDLSGYKGQYEKNEKGYPRKIIRVYK